MKSDRYVPALRFSSLTRFYDRFVRLTTRESLFKRRLLEQADPQPGQRILDLGCGTGTLAILTASAQPDAKVIGVDGDPEILKRARAKAKSARLGVHFDHGLSTELPYDDESFDLVLSTLVFHHLTGAHKRRTVSEIARVLKPGGELHVGDFGRPANPLMRTVIFATVRLFDGFEPTRDNVAGALPRIFAQGGLEDATETGRIPSMVGTLCLYRARRPGDSGPDGDR
jgi:ubiquinone/menaquinone biosynthesis C-methylase UbiE